FFQGAGIHADPDGNILVTGRIHHRTDAIFPPDIAGVDAQAVDAFFRDRQRDLIVEMNISHQRDIDPLADFTKRIRRLHGRHRHPYDIHAGIFHATDLANGCIHITGFGIGHRLDADGRIATNRDIAHHDLAGFTTFDGGFTVHDRLLTGADGILRIPAIAGYSPRVSRTTLRSGRVVKATGS